MIIKPFIKPVCTKLIEHDDSFVSTIFNKILSAGYGNYGLISLIYLRKPAEKYKEEEQDTKVEFNIDLIYNMLMQLSAVKNNPNYLNNNYIYYLNNVQNNINHYLKALSYIDKSIVSKSKSINDSLIIYGQLSNEIKNYNESFSNKNIVSHGNTNFLNNINDFYYSKHNIWNKSKASMLNSTSKSNINSEILPAIRNKVFNYNNIFNKYGFASNENNTTFNEQLFNEIKNYTESFRKNFKNSFYVNNIAGNNVFNKYRFALNKNIRTLSLSDKKNTTKTSIKNRNSTFNIINSMVNRSRNDMLNRNSRFNTHNVWNSYNSKFINEEFFNIYSSFEERILNKALYSKALNNATINKKFFINKSLGSNSIFDGIILKNLIKKDFHFTNLSYAHQFNEIKNYADIFRSNLKNLYINKFNELNHSINMESLNIQNLQEKIIKLNRNSNNNILEKQINNIAHSFNNYLYNKLYKNIDNYKSENIASYEYVDFLNTNALKTSNVFYYLQSKIRNKTKASIKNKNSTFNIINSMLNRSRNEILNRNFRFNTDNAWNSCNAKFINKPLGNNNSFYNEILNKTFYLKVLNKADINKEFYLNKLLSSSNSLKNLYINKFNQFLDNASLIIKGLPEKIITQNWNLKNSIFQRQIYGIAEKYNKFHKNSIKMMNKNFINYEKIKVSIKSNLESTSDYYEQYNEWNTKKYSIINKYSKFHNINSIKEKNKEQILSRSHILNNYSILHNDNIQSKNYFDSFNLNKSNIFTQLFYPELFTNNIFNKNFKSSYTKKTYFENLFNNELLLLTNKSIGNTSFLFQKNFLPKYSPINISRDYIPRMSLYNYKQNEFGNEVNSNYIMHNSNKANTNNNEAYEESYSDKVKIKHKRVQTIASKEDLVIEDIKTEHNTKYVTEENLKRFVNEAVETIIDNKLKSEKRIQAEEDKQVEIISNKVLAKIDRELKYEKRRRGLT